MRDRLLTRARFQARRLISKRRRFEELLREESQFAAIFESSAIGIVLADAEGRPRECNPAFSRMFGYTEAELRTMRISDFAHPDDAAKTERALKALIEGKLDRFHTEWRCIHKDGSLVWANLIASTILDANGELALTIATIENISDRKSAEADTDVAISARKSAEADTDVAISARESAEADTDEARDYAADLIETAGAMVVGLDLNGDIQIFNKAAEEITGYMREELAGRNWFEVVVPRERYPAVWETFERLLADGLPSRFENPILTKSGEERYIVWRNTEVKEDGLTTGTVSIGIDMTELKQAEEALRRERDLVAKIIETSPIGIVARDRQGEITFANADAERILGLTRNEATGQRYNAPDGRITDYEGRPFPDEELPLQRVMATGRPVYDVCYAIENASGERICLSVNAAPVLDGNGELDGMISSIEDVSERRRAKQTRELLEAELLQSQKLEAVGTLAGGVAHNFNNLLTAITGYSELLLARLPADSDLRPDVEEIRRAGERAAEVASGLLRFSRRGRDKHERLDLNVMIREMETLLRQVIRSNIEIVSVLADGLDLVENNQGVIEQVLVNLIVNASDAMPDGGKLTIETANLHLAEPRLVRDLSLPAGNFVTLTVRDSGTGMDDETQAKLFEPFYTTKGPDRGSGLGLSTVHGIVEDSEGAISVESAPGQGSTITVLLPSIPNQRLSP
jgi:PAS domain S-box-containing protein